MMRTLTFVFFTWLFCACAGAPLPLPSANLQNLRLPPPPENADVRRIVGRSLLVKNAELYDGLGTQVRSRTDILIEDGQITAIGPNLASDGLPMIDATDLFALPGLITSHSHLQSVPGSVLRGDDLNAVHLQQLLQLRTYLACGFTTVLDPAIGPETARRLRSQVSAGAPGPEILILAPFLTPADGYMTSDEMRGNAFAEFWPPVTPDTDVVALIQSAADLKPVGVKVAIEDGVVFPNLPLFNEQTMTNIREAGEETGQRLYVHSMTNAEHRLALKLNPYALVHVGLWDEDLADDILAILKQRQTYVISTAALQVISNWGWHRSFETDEWIRQRVPILQWETAVHPNSPARLNAVTSEMMRPSYVPAWLAKATADWFVPSPKQAAGATASSVAAIRLLHENGVPWVVGADEGNSPAYTTFFHGVSSLIEMESLEKSGVPPAAILQALTRTPARMLDASARIGSIEVGKRADLILLKKNPLKVGMKAFRTLQWTIARGEARTPASWLAD